MDLVKKDLFCYYHNIKLMLKVKLSGIPSNITKNHRNVINSFFNLLNFRTQRVIAGHYGRDHNTLVATVRNSDGCPKTTTFEFRENALKSPNLEKYNKRDLALVQLVGWHVFAPDTYGNFVFNPTFGYTLKEEDIVKSGKLNQLEHFDSDCCIALKNPGAKARTTKDSLGKEHNSDGSIFYLSPYSATKGGTAFFYKGRLNYAELSEDVQFYGCTKVQTFNSEDLRALECTNIRATNCSNTDIITTGDDPLSKLDIKNCTNKTIEDGHEVAFYTRLWRYLWRWDKKTDNLIKQFTTNNQPNRTGIQIASSKSQTHAVST